MTGSSSMGASFGYRDYSKSSTRNRGHTAPQLTGIAEQNVPARQGSVRPSQALRNEVNASLAGRIQSFTGEWIVDENVQENT
jgi:hypothetical protein